jgi:hypothetical protein
MRIAMQASSNTSRPRRPTSEALAMISLRPRLAGSSLVAILSLVCGIGVTWGQTPSAPPSAPVVSAAPHVEGGVRWQSLTPAQRQALGPLEHEWPTIEPARKQKWLAIAARFNTLPPEERARISLRMTEWARLSPAERGEARLRYQEARQVPASDRSARWEAYQKLGPDEKQQFAARAATASTVSAVPPRPPNVHEATQGKANVVTNPALARPPRAVAPTIVQASPGATTHLITRPTAPPTHQQTGMPKIAATSEFVNHATLLPQRGPQAAAVIPVSASSRPSAPIPPHPAAPPTKAVEPTLPR